MRNQRMLIIGLIALSGGLGRTAKPSTPTLKKVTEFDLPGPPGKRFDYLTIDPDDHYLLSAHLGAGQMYVIDLRTNKVVATVTDTPGAEGGRDSRNPQGVFPRACLFRRLRCWA